MAKPDLGSQPIGASVTWWAGEEKPSKLDGVNISTCQEAPPLTFMTTAYITEVLSHLIGFGAINGILKLHSIKPQTVPSFQVTLLPAPAHDSIPLSPSTKTQCFGKKQKTEKNSSKPLQLWKLVGRRDAILSVEVWWGGGVGRRSRAVLPAPRGLPIFGADTPLTWIKMAVWNLP